MGKVANKYFSVDPWKIIETGFDPAYARIAESVFSLGNESIGVRGCFDEGGSVDSLRGSYINGVYDLAQIGRSYRGIVDKVHFMIPAADWLNLSIYVDGEALDLGKVKYRNFKRILDMQAGTLTRSFVWETASGKELELTFLRFLDMNHRDHAYTRVTMTALNFSGSVEIQSGLSFSTVHEGRKTCFWNEIRRKATNHQLMIQARTTESGQEVFVGADLNLPDNAVIQDGDKSIYLRAEIPLVQSEPYVIDKRVVVLFDGTEGETLWANGEKALTENENLSDAAVAQAAYWEAYWAVSDIKIEPVDGEEKSVEAEQQGIR